MKDKRLSESGNAVIIVLVVLVVVAVGAVAYLSGQMAGEQMKDDIPLITAQSESEDTNDATNPVVAIVNGENVRRNTVLEFITTLPENLRVVPMDQLYPMALEQVISNQIIESKVENADLKNNQDVQKQLAQAKQQIMRSVYIQQEVEKRITDERLQEAYEAYKEGFPEIEEVKARHILVKEEGKAKEIIQKLNDGADFAELAKEHSTDATSESGGDLGYFVQKDVVPEFGEAVYALEEGTYTKEPVKSAFGYHVIKLEDKRMRSPAEFEEAKEFLESTLRRNLLEQVVRDWRQEAQIVRYDINGNPLEPAAGAESMVPKTSSEESPAEEAAASEDTTEQ